MWSSNKTSVDGQQLPYCNEGHKENSKSHSQREFTHTHTLTRIDRNTHLHSLISLFFKGGVLGVEPKARS